MLKSRSEIDYGVNLGVHFDSATVRKSQSWSLVWASQRLDVVIFQTNNLEIHVNGFAVEAHIHAPAVTGCLMFTSR